MCLYLVEALASASWVEGVDDSCKFATDCATRPLSDKAGFVRRGTPAWPFVRWLMVVAAAASTLPGLMIARAQAASLVVDQKILGKRYEFGSMVDRQGRISRGAGAGLLVRNGQSAAP